MNFNRIKALLRYDWTLEKRNFFLTIMVFTIIFISMVLLFFMYNGLFGLDVTELEGLPIGTSVFCAQFFNYAYLIMGLVVTQVLHRKFTNPRTSLSYLTMPGTNAEKWITMILNYLFAMAAVFALQAVLYEASVITGYCLAPDLNWDFNPFKYLGLASGNDIREMMLHYAEIQESGAENSELLSSIIDKLVGPILLFAPIASLFHLGIYIVINMCFRSHGQLKSIACIFTAYIIFIITASVIMIKTAFAAEISADKVMNIIAGDGLSVFNCIKWYYFSSPLLCAGIYYLFYKQICWKQAK